MLACGWDVGGWNCENNSRSRDALVCLDENGQRLGSPWRGNLRDTILASSSSSEFIDSIYGLCDLPEYIDPTATILAIDAPLGFPEAFVRLNVQAETARLRNCPSHQNPYLFRYTERRLLKDGVTPLSSVKDMIGSQATKAMHVAAKFAPESTTTGVWSDGKQLTIIETYPALYRHRLKLSKPTGTAQEIDIKDALLCARVAHAFFASPEILEHPDEGAPASEGWIWAPASPS